MPINLTKKKTQYCFSLFNREGVFKMKYIDKKQTNLMITCSPKEALNRSEQGDNAARVLKFLMRNYEQIFRKEKQINLEKAMELLGLSFYEIQKQLSLMDKENILEFKKSNSDIKLYWKIPREDSYTINPFLKRIAAENDLKAKKIVFMIDYAFETSECKRNKILRYFGEEKVENCQQCSAINCQRESNPDREVKLEITKNPEERSTKHL